MALSADLTSYVRQLFGGGRWNTRDGRAVPESEDLGLGKEAIKLDATVLYADISGSTMMVDKHPSEFAAEIYKAFLHCTAKIVKDEGGDITAYDGDRIMAVFINDGKNTRAARAALKINFGTKNIIGPQISAFYGARQFQLKHVVGVDTSALFVARTGVRGANDLVWVGRAANHAAKLTTLPDTYASYITKAVYDSMNADMKTHQGRSMWELVTWTAMANAPIYRSTWTYTVP
jgi:class 3 adenylate cyclase